MRTDGEQYCWKW